MRPGPIVVERELVVSRAFRDLDGKAAKVLMWFLAKRQMTKVPAGKRKEWMIVNNGEIIFTYREAEDKHSLKPQAFSRAIGDLLVKGFVDIESPGTGIGKAPTLFAISERWRKYGTTEFDFVERKKRSSHRFPLGKKHPIHRKTSIS